MFCFNKIFYVVSLYQYILKAINFLHCAQAFQCTFCSFSSVFIKLELYAMQIKDMAIKISGYRQCKPCTGSSSYKKGQRPYPDYDMASEGVPYPYLGGGSSSSTPAWDFTSAGRHPTGRSDTRFMGVYSDDRTPRGLDTASIQSCDVVLEDEDEPKEWMAQVEPGVHITFLSLPNGGNDLKRIRFRYLIDHLFSRLLSLDSKFLFQLHFYFINLTIAMTSGYKNIHKILEFLLGNIKSYWKITYKTPKKKYDSQKIGT